MLNRSGKKQKAGRKEGGDTYSSWIASRINHTSLAFREVNQMCNHASLLYLTHFLLHPSRSKEKTSSLKAAFQYQTNTFFNIWTSAFLEWIAVFDKEGFFIISSITREVFPLSESLWWVGLRKNNISIHDQCKWIFSVRFYITSYYITKFLLGNPMSRY